MAWVNICDIIYPIGAYYISHDSTPPGELFGGTWAAVRGKFLYCNAGTSTGGSNTHTLTVDEIPSHQHTFQSPTWYYAEGTSGSSIVGARDTATPAFTRDTSYTGGGKAHNNMPAYQTVYAWRRTA